MNGVIKVKTQRMKSKDRYLGVLNMPDSTEVSSLIWLPSTLNQGGCGEEAGPEQEEEAAANYLP